MRRISKNHATQITSVSGSAFKTPEACFDSATGQVINQLRLANGVETGRIRSLFNSRTKERPRYATACQASAGRFFGDFLWTSKESRPAAGRDRRTWYLHHGFRVIRTLLLPAIHKQILSGMPGGSLLFLLVQEK